MTWTLYRYLAKELIRVGFLAAVALTLVMTLFAIVEPLRVQQGLNAAQIARLFWYLVPVMLSLTLPIAALFAATIVYGRFAMDNELTACRASGVGTLTLVKPAIVMGLLVSAATLGLSNWIAPHLARLGEQASKANLRGLVYQHIRAKGFFKRDHYIVYADDADPDTQQLRGVVVFDVGNPYEANCLAAQAARADFAEDGDQTMVTLTLANLTSGAAGGGAAAHADYLPFGPVPVGSLMKESPGFYDWSTLSRIRTDPQQSPEVQRQLEEIRRQLRVHDFYEAVEARIRQDGHYVLRQGDGRQYLVRPPKTQMTATGGVLLVSKEDLPAQERQVLVEEWLLDGAVATKSWTRRCREASIKAQSDPLGQVTEASLTLVDFVQDDMPDFHNGQMTIGPLEVPEGPQASSDEVTLTRLANDPHRYAAVRGARDRLLDYVRRLDPKVVAEMHGRLAYGLGCLLLVGLGAGLGMIYRGGQMLSAFAISCVPATILIILIVAGRQLISNPQAATFYQGLAAIWGGVLLLAAMLGYVYGVVLRR